MLEYDANQRIEELEKSLAKTEELWRQEKQRADNLQAIITAMEAGI